MKSILDSLIINRNNIASYLRSSNMVIQKYSDSQIRKKIFLNMMILKDNIDDSALIEILENSIEELSQGRKAQDIQDINIDSCAKKIVLNLEGTLDNLNEYLLQGTSLFSKVKNLFSNDSFGSLIQGKCELKLKYLCEEITLKTDDDNCLDALLIKSLVQNHSSTEYNSTNNNSHNTESTIINASHKASFNTKRQPKVVMVICGPNAMAYESMAYSGKWIDFYLYSGMQVFLWNYRGFGNSTGTSNFKNLKEDSEIVIKFLKKHYHWDKIGVHGLSLGGIPACHLAGKDLVDLVMADRCFSSIEDIVHEFPLGSLLSYFYKIFLFDYSNNVDHFLKSKAVKILSCDPSDKVIKNNASLKTGISKEIFPKLIKQNANRKNDDIIKIIVGGDKREYELFHKVFKDCSKKFTNLINKEKDNVTLKKSKKNYEKLVEEVSTVEVISINESKYSDEDKILLSLISLIDKLDCAGEVIFSIDKMNQLENRVFLNNFFLNLFVWGSQKFNRTLSIESSNSFKLTLKKLSIILQKLGDYNQFEKHDIKDPNVKELLKGLLTCLLKFDNLYKRIYLKDQALGNINSCNNIIYNQSIECGNIDDNIEVINHIENLNVGNLIPLSCGHNGLFNHEEMSIYENYLRSYKFIL